MTEFNINSIPSQKGRIAIVTGANTGLGFETALALAGKDMKVIMACRNADKAESARQRILLVVPSADIEILIIDLNSLSSVREFSKKYLEKFNKLDLLINNAGIMIPKYYKTADGFESQMGTNFFAHFLLTGLLLDVLSHTPDSRIVCLGSIAHINGTIKFDDIHWEKKYSAMAAYRQSKLACLMFSFELQRRLENAGLKTISVAAHPGVSVTDLVRHIPKLLQLTLLPVFALFTHNPDKGALPTLMAALDPDVKGGDYYGPQGPSEWKGKPGKAKSTALSHDISSAEKLWDISEKLTGIKFL